MTNRYTIRNNCIYDIEERKTLSLEEIVDLLNKFEDREWDIFVNGGH